MQQDRTHKRRYCKADASRFKIKARTARIYFCMDDKTGKYETGASVKFCRKFKKRMNEKTVFTFRDFSERRLQNIGYFWRVLQVKTCQVYVCTKLTLSSRQKNNKNNNDPRKTSVRSIPQIAPKITICVFIKN